MPNVNTIISKSDPTTKVYSLQQGEITAPSFGQITLHKQGNVWVMKIPHKFSLR